MQIGTHGNTIMLCSCVYSLAAVLYPDCQESDDTVTTFHHPLDPRAAKGIENWRPE